MKTRLLKRLRRQAKKNVVIYKKLDWRFPYHIGCLDNKVHWVITSYRTLEEAKIKLIEERRNYIINVIKIMRIERENKQLRKL
jgi:hypothetical protein